MKKIFIYGIGSAGRVVLRLINDINEKSKEWDVVGFVGNSSEKVGKKIDGLDVFKHDQLPSYKTAYGICGMMDTSLKKKIVNSQIKKNNHIIPTLIHPSVIRRDEHVIGAGTIILERSAIGFSTILGDNVWVDAHVLIGHDVVIDNFAAIMPSSVIGGNCKIGKLCLIGSGSTIHPGIIIGNNSNVGIGTTIIKNVRENTSIINFPRNVEREL